MELINKYYCIPSDMDEWLYVIKMFVDNGLPVYRDYNIHTVDQYDIYGMFPGLYVTQHMGINKLVACNRDMSRLTLIDVSEFLHLTGLDNNMIRKNIKQHSMMCNCVPRDLWQYEILPPVREHYYDEYVLPTEDYYDGDEVDDEDDLETKEVLGRSEALRHRFR